jgi:chromosome segregation protein
MDGYPESVKFLHKNTGWNHNAPILSDILYVQEAYRTAVENVLEPYLNYYVDKKNNSYLVAIENFTKNYKLVHLLRQIDEYELLGLSRFNLPKPNLL